MTRETPTGVLLLQLGTPDSPAPRHVRRFLREFLSDPRVLDMPAPLRNLLLYGVILPFRPRRSAEAYRQIWTDAGSPISIHTQDLEHQVAMTLGAGYVVTHGMRYRRPSIESALQRLIDAGCEEIVAVPLFPQYASSAGGTAVAKLLDLAATKWNVPPVSVVAPFYDHPGFIEATAELARERLAAFEPDHILFSYHGLPAQQVAKSHDLGGDCTAGDGACRARVTEQGQYCYVAHCFATSRALLDALDLNALGLDRADTTTVFQSRLAGQRWLEPYTDTALEELAAGGAKRVAVFTPSFTADCLETLEEIGIRGVEQFTEAGGDDLLLLPCVNSSPTWAKAVADMVRAKAGAPGPNLDTTRRSGLV